METICRATEAWRPLTQATTPTRATWISRARVGSGTAASSAWRTIGASVPSTSSSTPDRSGSSLRGRRSSSREAVEAGTPVVCPRGASDGRTTHTQANGAGPSAASTEWAADRASARSGASSTSRRSASTRSSCRPATPAGRTTTTARRSSTSSTAATIEFTFGEGDDEEYHVLGPGGLARVDAATDPALPQHLGHRGGRLPVRRRRRRLRRPRRPHRRRRNAPARCRRRRRAPAVSMKPRRP